VNKAAEIIIINNPTAGPRRQGFLKSVLRDLVARGHKVDLRLTTHPGHASAIAKSCISNPNISLLVAAGGDGTIREVAEGMLGSSIPLGIIPVGTANVLARELGYLKAGRRSIRRTVSILEGTCNQKIYPFSVCLAEREMLGLCWVGVGFDAEVLKHVHGGLKKKIGRAAFIPAILKALFKEPVEPSVPWSFGKDDTAGKNNTGTCGWALITNIGKYAGPFRVTKKTSLREKGLACLLFPQAGWLARVVDQLIITYQPLDQRAGTQPFTGGVLKLGAEKIPVQLDGDLVGEGPATISLLETALIVKAASGV